MTAGKATKRKSYQTTKLAPNNKATKLTNGESSKTRTQVIEKAAYFRVFARYFQGNSCEGDCLEAETWLMS